MEENVLLSVSLKKAFKLGIFKSVSAVRTNEKGYPFVTVVNGKKANNVYFGKNSGEGLEKDDVLTSEQIKKAEFVIATNEDGEQRLKLSLSSDSGYTNLGSIFDDEVSDDEKKVLKMLASEMLAEDSVPAVGVANEA